MVLARRGSMGEGSSGAEHLTGHESGTRGDPKALSRTVSSGQGCPEGSVLLAGGAGGTGGGAYRSALVYSDKYFSE